MTAVHFDLETVRNDLNDIADASPEYIYKSTSADGCVYFVDDSASCIVGKMFAKHGIAADSLTGLLNSRRIDLLPAAAPEVVSFDKDALEYASSVQSNQDIGMSWGDSVKDAEYMILGRES